MAVVLGHDETLLYFVFHHQRLELRASSAELLEEARAHLVTEDFVLVQGAISLWVGTGHLMLSEILEELDDERLLNFVRGILKYREIGDERRHDLLEYPC